jgi:catechol 1,2-dioxygenase
MKSELLKRAEIMQLLDRVSGLDRPSGDPRTKQILRRVIADLYAVIDEFNVTPEEFWSTLAFLQAAAPEFGLIAPGLGFDHFLDIRMDAADQERGRTVGTPRTIEGPLYVAGAPLTKVNARLDDGTDEGGDTLVMHGRVLDAAGAPIGGAIVDVWHANSRGGYSFFDPTQIAYNNRGRIETDGDGRYNIQSIVPSGYAVPERGATERLLGAVGRHGRRPAHIHFFVSAPGFRHLTTQVNIDGDPDLYDDFAHATRGGLIAKITRRTDVDSISAMGPDAAFSEIEFDFVMTAAEQMGEGALPSRPRVIAPA